MSIFCKIPEDLNLLLRKCLCSARPSDYTVLCKGEAPFSVKSIAEQLSQRLVLRSIPKEAFADSFQKLYERCQECVVKDGNYFKGQ
jgi:hypothetical protein